ncbi:MAG: hypothetical protein KDB52_06420 [Solirubrobacterales bacterium]|nr:hypothetical protein [Solirubrobacterales bacterium]
MERNRFTRSLVLLLTAGSLVFGLTACGSDDSGSDGGTTTEITPDKKAPESAGDKSKNAPDDVVSEKPGGSGTPVSP